jgi:BlaI family transcriptional regulator, penicillinase repressor
MNLNSLNNNEIEALRILWEKGACKPADIQAGFSWPIENATLRSALVNLVEKGCAARTLQGKAFYYSARVPKTTLLAQAMQSMARIFAGGSEKALVAQLAETADLRPEDILLLKQAAASKPSSKERKTK